ncbi:MAG: hypothetical protein ABSF71_18200 [Terriglobia bacterium]
MERPCAHGPQPPHHTRPLKGKLLLVDEDTKDLRHYSNLLDELGYEVRAFSSYGDAAACLEREMFDMVVVSPGDLQV